MRQKIWIFHTEFWLAKVSDSWALECGSIGDVFLHHVQPWGPAALRTLARLSMPVIQEDPEVKVIISYPVSLSQSEDYMKPYLKERETRHLVVWPWIPILIVYVLHLSCFYKVVLTVILSNFYGYSDFSLHLILQITFNMHIIFLFYANICLCYKY